MQRPDAMGLFWQDVEQERKRGQIKVKNEPQPIPKTDWRPPKEFPNLSAAKMLIIDIESKDPNLVKQGPGFVRGDAYMVGLAVGTEDGHKWYFPIRHEYDPNHMNLDYDQVIKWANDNLTRPNQPKLGAHILYDLEGLHYSGVDVAGPFYDVQIAEPLIDEHAIGQYNLEALANKYLNEGKIQDQMNQWAADSYGGRPIRKDQAKNIWRCPPELVGAYAESDVDLPLRIIKEQKKILNKEKLLDLFRLECRLLPLLLNMRLTGVPVDINRAKELNDIFTGKIEQEKKKLKSLTGYNVEHIWAAEEISRLFDKAGIKYPLTKKTQKPSITKEFLKNHPSDIADSIRKIRTWDKLLNPFIQGYVLNDNVNGRVYPQFNQLKSDEKGAAPGRFSSSNPNLQNIPQRTDEGRLLRSMFVPFDGEEWNKADYSQIEYRLLVHYAEGEIANEVKEQYHRNPKTDYHSAVQEKLKQISGMNRYAAKTINFGTIYGMGDYALSIALGLELKEAKILLEKIQKISPYAKELSNELNKVAARGGFIKTILNRKNRFPFWEPMDWELSKKTDVSKDKQKIIDLVNNAIQIAKKNRTKVPRGGVKRAYTYTALNKLLQGSAADIMKKAMVDVWEAGLPFPMLITVHDELDWSSPKTKQGREASKEVSRIMENAIELDIPVLVDHEIGTNWGQLK